MTTPGRPRRVAAPATWLVALALALALTLAGCAALGAAFHAGSALQGAGYQDANVNVSTGSGLPADGLVTVTYSRGPSGDDPQDVQGAEKIVWDTFSTRFGVLHVVKVSGGCTGPVCVTHSAEVASVTYAQLAARLGPRPHGLEKSSAVPGWAIALGAVAGLSGLIALAVIVAALILRRRKRKGQPPGPPPWPPWPPGPPAAWPSDSP